MSETSVWLQRVIDGQGGEESVLVGRFAAGLIARARGSMSDQLRRRLDPEDVIQSVFRSFFVRQRDGQFQFETENDVWRLLCAMTYRKVARVARYHHQQRRAVQREELREGNELTASGEELPEDAVVLLDILERLLRDLPADTQRIVGLRLEDYSHAEIAAELGVSERTVRRSLARVRAVAEALLIEDEAAGP